MVTKMTYLPHMFVLDRNNIDDDDTDADNDDDRADTDDDDEFP